VSGGTQFAGWGDSECENPRDKCVQRLLEQATHSPDSVAVEHLGEQLTYAVNNRACQPARPLSEDAVRKDGNSGGKLRTAFSRRVGCSPRYSSRTFDVKAAVFRDLPKFDL
jgi:non-ribosomal peptide synthetase component F